MFNLQQGNSEAPRSPSRAGDEEILSTLPLERASSFLRVTTCPMFNLRRGNAEAAARPPIGARGSCPSPVGREGWIRTVFSSADASTWKRRRKFESLGDSEKTNPLPVGRGAGVRGTSSLASAATSLRESPEPGLRLRRHRARRRCRGDLVEIVAARLHERSGRSFIPSFPTRQKAG
jgi:hypothetical protein